MHTFEVLLLMMLYTKHRMQAVFFGVIYYLLQVNATLATSEIRMRAQQKEINLRYFRDETVKNE